MDDYLSMEFSDAEAAAAYLQQQVSAAGIEVTITENGFQAMDLIADPGNVGAQLAARGIHNRATVGRAIAEANTAILGVEGLVQAAQQTITPSAAGTPVTTNEVPDPDTAPFLEFVPAWQGLLPNGFSELYAATPPPPAATDGSATGAPADSQAEPIPQTLLSIERQLPSGVVVRADVATAFINAAGTGAEPGYYVPPFKSLFDTAESWKLYA